MVSVVEADKAKAKIRLATAMRQSHVYLEIPFVERLLEAAERADAGIEIRDRHVKALNTLAAKVCAAMGAEYNCFFDAQTALNELIAAKEAAEAQRDRLAKALRPCVSALRSYQYGNSSPDLAKEVADVAAEALKEADTK